MSNRRDSFAGSLRVEQIQGWQVQTDLQTEHASEGLYPASQGTGPLDNGAHAIEHDVQAVRSLTNAGFPMVQDFASAPTIIGSESSSKR